VSVIILASIVTLCNSIKPLHIDDAAYAALAAQIAENPLAPYAGAIYWDYQWQPANEVLAPPVVLYWTATAMSLFGNEPWLWKLSFWPLHVLLVGALFALLRRFTGPAALALTWMTGLGPALLPSTNLMLDVPALALSLSAIALHLHATERRSLAGALVAGVVGGLALQTKYTAVTVPMVFLAWGFLQRRPGLALAAVSVAVAVFLSWEAWVALGQGHSHFLLALQHRSGSAWARVRHLVSPLFTMTASVAPGVVLVAALAWTRSSRWLVAGFAAIMLGALSFGIAPVAALICSGNAASGLHFDLEVMLYLLLTSLWWSAFLVAIARLLRHCRSDSYLTGDSAATLFLIVWLALEIVGYFALSPFPAARRMFGLVVVATLLAGRLALAAGVARSRALWLATTANAACGLLIAYVDFCEAEAPREAVRAVAGIAEGMPSGSTTWFSGAWSFPFYAERQGFRPALHGESKLRRGDLLVLAEQPRNRVDFHPQSAPLTLESIVCMEADIPLQTVPCYYGGRTVLRHLEGPRIRVAVYRVLEDFVPTAYGELPGLH
jgi:4-amino-4-deoxy-L-arabinose transferase-like glycosyltransferase